MVNFWGHLLAEAVIFDFDGVIVDTEPIHYQAFQKVLEPMGLGFSWQEYIDTYMGFDDRDAFKEAFNTGGRLIELSDLYDFIKQKALIFQEIICDGITAYPGVVDLIKKLHKERVPLAICSGALHSDIAPILKTLEITDYFEIIITADDVSKSKPAPECYLLAFDLLSAKHPDGMISKAGTIAIEDTPAGIASARLAGLKVVAVTNSYPREQISEATCVVSSLEELMDFHITQESV